MRCRSASDIGIDVEQKNVGTRSPWILVDFWPCRYCWLGNGQISNRIGGHGDSTGLTNSKTATTPALGFCGGDLHIGVVHCVGAAREVLYRRADGSLREGCCIQLESHARIVSNLESEERLHRQCAGTNVIGADILRAEGNGGRRIVSQFDLASTDISYADCSRYIGLRAAIGRRLCLDSADAEGTVCQTASYYW